MESDNLLVTALNQIIDFETLNGVLRERFGDQFQLLESSMSRIYQHIKSDKSFVILSAYHKKYPEPINKERHNILRGELSRMGYGYIETYGGYGYKEDTVNIMRHEKSFFVPLMKKEDGLSLGKKFEQESIIYKGLDTVDGKETVVFGLYDCDSGNLLGTFDQSNTFTTNPEMVFKIAYSALVKNNSKKDETIEDGPKGKRFAFNMESTIDNPVGKLYYVVESVPPDWGLSMALKNQVRYLRIV